MRYFLPLALFLLTPACANADEAVIPATDLNVSDQLSTADISTLYARPDPCKTDADWASENPFLLEPIDVRLSGGETLAIKRAALVGVSGPDLEATKNDSRDHIDASRLDNVTMLTLQQPSIAPDGTCYGAQNYSLSPIAFNGYNPDSFLANAFVPSRTLAYSYAGLARSELEAYFSAHTTPIKTSDGHTFWRIEESVPAPDAARSRFIPQQLEEQALIDAQDPAETRAENVLSRPWKQMSQALVCKRRGVCALYEKAAIFYPDSRHGFGTTHSMRFIFPSTVPGHAWYINPPSIEGTRDPDPDKQFAREIDRLFLRLDSFPHRDLIAL